MICVNAFILFYSSVSSMINSLAAVLWTDFLKLKFGHLSDNKATIINKILGKMHLGYINNMYIPYMQFIVELTKTYVILKHNYNLLAFAFGCLGIGLGIAVSKLPGTVLQVSDFL